MWNRSNASEGFVSASFSGSIGMDQQINAGYQCDKKCEGQLQRNIEQDICSFINTDETCAEACIQFLLHSIHNNKILALGLEKLGSMTEFSYEASQTSEPSLVGNPFIWSLRECYYVCRIASTIFRPLETLVWVYH